jgi:hypothetical protein
MSCPVCSIFCPLCCAGHNTERWNTTTRSKLCVLLPGNQSLHAQHLEG